VSSAIGVLVLTLIALAMRDPVPPLQRLTGAPWSAWIGGIVGAAYAVTVVLLARQLGAATLVALVVSGQLVCSVLLDHFGLLGFGERASTHHQRSAVRDLDGGVVLLRSGRCRGRTDDRRHERVARAHHARAE